MNFSLISGRLWWRVDQACYRRSATSVVLHRGGYRASVSLVQFVPFHQRQQSGSLGSTYHPAGGSSGAVSTSTVNAVS